LKTLSIFLLLTCLTVPALAQTWSKKPPQIGRLYLKQEYWDYIKEAAKKYNVSPCLILAVCASA
jgi:soluble lytic murein transglycosylase-like protein